MFASINRLLEPSPAVHKRHTYLTLGSGAPQMQNLRRESAQQETIIYSATQPGDPTLSKAPAGRGACYAMSIHVHVRACGGPHGVQRDGWHGR